ncbi:sensor histidine kinase [Streptomyces lanatus]|uniref:histidine kinase n=1 Tax=Streptomyces lanatus TaxID=66900 RepID=A0ABV1XLW6_9ACTN|nr:sensor histidine kinase [Streptomyces lanatus]
MSWPAPATPLVGPGMPVANGPRMPVPSPQLNAFALAAAGTAFGIWVLVVTAPDRYADSTSTLFSGAVGGLYLGAGLLARLRRPGNVVGALMLLVGIGWFAEDLQISTDPRVHTVGLFLRSASTGFLIPLLLVFPYGRLRSREDHGPVAALADRILLATGCTVAFVLQPVAVFFHDSVTDNLLLVHYVPWLRQLTDAIQLVVSAAVVAVLLWRWAGASRPYRRELGPLLAVGLVGGLASGLDAALGADREWSHTPLLTATHLSVLCLPLAFLAGVWRIRLGRTAVAELLRRLPLDSRRELRDELARTLDDASLQLGFPAPDGDGYVDVDGRALTAGPGQWTSVLERDGRRVGVLVHDPALREDRYVLEAVVSAAALELDNQALVAELRASRRRVIEAGDEQRREVERNLHDGAQQRFINLGLQLRIARRRLDRAASGAELAGLLDGALAMLEQGHAELRVAARGIHPVVLSEAGLAQALRSLTADLPLPVDLHVDKLPQLPEPVELTAYYVVKEAISNVLKHADARTVRVELHHSDGVLNLSVTDDGVGGADPASGGTGLLGLRHRVSAYDGRLTVRSRPGEGTVVAVTLPTRERATTKEGGLV